MSEFNPHQYGDRYVLCSACGIKLPPGDVKDGKCVDTKRCARLKASVEAALKVKPMLEPKG